MNLKLRIMCRAVRLRLERGEQLEAVLASYPALTKDECNQIMQEVLEFSSGKK